jgi:hypothetical protein
MLPAFIKKHYENYYLLISSSTFSNFQFNWNALHNRLVFLPIKLNRHLINNPRLILFDTANDFFIYLNIIKTVLRFKARPSSVLLEVTGWVSAKPLYRKRLGCI